MGRQVRVRTKIDHAAISMLVEQPGEIRRWFDAKILATVLQARAEAPKRTGSLAKGISSTYHGAGRWTISATADYARIVHEGSKPHKITPRSPRKWLQWEQAGRIVWAREVNHPGTKPNPYLVRALDEVWGTRR